jgi:hypothetical protein
MNLVVLPRISSFLKEKKNLNVDFASFKSAGYNLKRLRC